MPDRVGPPASSLEHATRPIAESGTKVKALKTWRRNGESAESLSFIVPRPRLVDLRDEHHDRARLNDEYVSLNRLRLGPGADIARRVSEGIYTTPPRNMVLVERWYGKRKSLPEGIDHDMQNDPVGFEVSRGREAMRRVAPVRLAQRDAMPFDGVTCDQLVQRHIEALHRERACPAIGDELTHEAVKVRVPPDGRPVEPCGFVVEAV